jgi:type IV pilus assembly protein PilC
MEYAYKIRDNEGRVQRAVAQAESPQVLRARLLAKGIEVIEIKQAEATRFGDLVVLRSTMRLFESISLKDLVVFSRQFAAMVTAGVPMLRTLTIVVEQSKNGKMRDTLDDVRRSVEAGLSLSDALARHPLVFDKLYISMVRAGEAGGFLSEVLRRLADFLEARQKLNRKVTAAMVYPSVVLVIALGVFWGMLTFILPIFEGLFKNIGGELPAYTQFLIFLSECMRSVWMALFLVGLLVCVWLFRNYYRTTTGRLTVDQALLKVPVVGDLIRKVSIARFTRTFGTLIKAGVPMLSALDVVKDTSGNAEIAIAVERVYVEVRQGGSIAKPMSKNPVFPPMVTQMVAVGEETGRLDDMLEKVADFYDMEVENAVDSLTSLLEPIMVVGIGGIVGSVVIGMYLPIFTLINQLH